MKRLSALIIAFCLLLGLSACTESSTHVAERELDLKLGSAELTAEQDSHGGFHGDGLAYFVFKCLDDSVKKQIEDSGKWSPLPMNEVARTLAYGYETDDASVGPYLTADGFNAVLPEIKNGYYILIDRQENTEKGTGILNRSSFNLTLAVYDTDTDTLHYLSLDT